METHSIYDRHSPLGWRACYTRAGNQDTASKTRYMYKDVMGWHPETGVALVVDAREGYLMPASSGAVTPPGWTFSGLIETDQIVGVLPGTGWRYAHEAAEKTGATGDVMALVVLSSGEILPLIPNHHDAISGEVRYGTEGGWLIGPNENLTGVQNRADNHEV